MERKIDRFDKYMKYSNLNDNKVTVSIGLSVGTLGKSRKIGRDLSDRVIEQILKFYTDINRIWLLTGEGEMLIKDNPAEPSNKNVIINHVKNEEMNIDPMFAELMKAIHRRDDFLEKQQDDFNSQIRILTDAIERRDKMAINQQEVYKEQVDRLISLLEKMQGLDDSNIITPKKRNTGLEDRP